MRPQFGCRIWDLLFEPVTANLLGLMAQAVRDALAQWEPRVEVEDVDAVPDPRGLRAGHASPIAYRVRPPTTAATWSTLLRDPATRRT